jgi:hypothetical protein
MELPLALHLTDQRIAVAVDDARARRGLDLF